MKHVCLQHEQHRLILLGDALRLCVFILPSSIEKFVQITLTSLKFINCQIDLIH